MFNKAKKEAKKKAKVERDLTAERNERCLPAARKILQIIAKGKIEDVDGSQLFGDYVPLVRESMDVFMEHDIRLAEVDYVFGLALMSSDILKNTVNQSLDKSLSTVELKQWGKDGKEITVNDIDKILKEDA